MDRDTFISGKCKQSAGNSMVLTAGNGRVLFCSSNQPRSRVDITHARQLGLGNFRGDGNEVTILADVGYRGLGAQSSGRVATPPHRKFKKKA